MPISFIITGLILIYTIFYKQKLKYKNVCIALLIFLLLGFFINEINILNGVLVNAFIFIPVFVFASYFILKLNKIEGIIFFVGVGISLCIYSIIVLKNMELSTLFNPLIIFLISLVFIIPFSVNLNLSASYILSTFTMYDIFNILLIKNSTGVVTILSISTYSLIIYSLIISLTANKIVQLIKSKDKEKDVNV